MKMSMFSRQVVSSVENIKTSACLEEMIEVNTCQRTEGSSKIAAQLENYEQSSQSTLRASKY